MENRKKELFNNLEENIKDSKNTLNKLIKEIKLISIDDKQIKDLKLLLVEAESKLKNIDSSQFSEEE